MTDHALPRLPRRQPRNSGRSRLMLPFALLAALVVGAGIFVSFMLWPQWPSGPVSLNAPAIPITIADVLFDVPPAAIRAAVQRHAGPHERIDLAFTWPSLTPPQPAGKGTEPAAPAPGSDAGATPADGSERLFVTIARLGSVLPPAERLRAIYPRYAEAEADAGPQGLAILPFRASTPYAGEDLVYLAGDPERFFARCTRKVGAMRGSCLHERLIDAAELTVRFPRDWLDDWPGVDGGIARLIAQLHPQRN